MNKIATLTTTALLLCSAAAMAQTSTQGGAQPPAAGQMAPSSTSPANTTTVREQMSNTLKQAGFTDIHIVPDSYLVQAKDKSGNPVAMFVGPNSVTEMVAEGSAGGASQGANNFVSNAGSDMLGSKLMGADVYDSSNQSIGPIKDIAFKDGRIAAIVVSVGGFLHMGERYVAMAPQALNVSYGNGGKAVHVTTTATEAQLKAAPAFNYPNG